MNNLGIYVHIPFCKSKCYYCDFDSQISSYDIQKNYIDVLVSEMKRAYSIYNLNDKAIDTIYIGGGTPTSLDKDLLEILLLSIDDIFCKNYSKNLEYTIETNPNSITEEKIKIIKKNKINRVSIGLQSCHKDELSILGRSHNFDDFLQSIKLFQKHNFSNINVDLMFGIPKQSIESFSKTIKRVLSLDVNHISAYGLILEKGTKFYDMYQKGHIKFADDEKYVQMYEYLVATLEEKGFNRYEISNFSKKGYQCRHNIKYWKSMPYIGFGRSAHSFYGGRRFYNKKDDYIKLIRSKGLATSEEVEIVDDKSLFDEWIMLRLRMREGINIDEINKRFNIDFMKKYQKITHKYIQDKCMKYNGKNIYLTTKGFEITNRIILDLLSL